MIGDMSSSEAVTSRVACIKQSAGKSNKITTAHVIRMPCDGTHAPPPTDSHPTTDCTAERACSPAVCKGHDLTFATKIPYDRVPGSTCASKNILHLLVPSDRRDLIELRTATARRRRVRLCRIIEVPYIDLLVCTNAPSNRVTWK